MYWSSNKSEPQGGHWKCHARVKESRRRQGIAKHDRHRQITDAAKNKPCQDCGVSYPPWVMDFEHPIGEKKFSIGEGKRSRTRAALIEEIGKCEVICANYHRDRTHMEREAVAC